MCPLPPRPSLKTAQSLAVVADDDNGARESRSARLERLRQALQNGTYRPPVLQIAERMLASGDLA